MFQSMRVAEMEGRTADDSGIKTQAEAARASFLEISDVVKKIQTEIDARIAAKEEAGKPTKANSNAEANKK
ncbi:MAG: hypothetical protein IPK98_04020 [Chloracidobacterium sp.]|nr:hypothetical protein [Chloracidobacterium sp.]